MNVLVVAAHPDDEVLGAGATASRLAASGARIAVLILGEGVGLRHPGATLDAVRAAAEAAGKAIGASRVDFGGLARDGRLLDEVPSRSLVNLISRGVHQARAELVFTHHPGDIHVDHRRVAESTFYAVRVLGGSTVRRVLCYEVLSSTEQSLAPSGAAFKPNVYYDVKDHVKSKLEALAHYTAEVRPYPHPRSAEAVDLLAKLRGVEVGVEAAEAFMLVRELL